MLGFQRALRVTTDSAVDSGEMEYPYDADSCRMNNISCDTS